LRFFNFGYFFNKLGISILQKHKVVCKSRKHLSNPFEIKICRECDPSSSDLFILYTEILANKIRQNKCIIGITINETYFKISQFADETLLFLDGSKNHLEKL